MDWQIKSVQRVAKQIVAGTIFVTLLLGASAAVFSALAAGITSLSNADSYTSTTTFTTHPPVSGSSASTTGTGPIGSTETNPGGTNPVSTSSRLTNSGDGSPVQLNGGLSSGPQATAAAATGQVAGNLNWGDRISNSLAHMHSPVTEALDSGGVTLGNQLSHSFGHVLSNLIQFLFVEQADGSSGSNSGAASPSSSSSSAFGSTPPSQYGSGSSGY